MPAKSSKSVARDVGRRSAAQRSVSAARGTRSVSRGMSVVLPVGLVVALVAVLVVVKSVAGSPKPKSGAAASAASASVSARVSSVPVSVLDQIGLGTVSSPPKALAGSPLTVQGKPRVLYVGAEWCPYCAAERWGLAVALSRFGTLSGLSQVRSSPTDVYPNTATLSFHGSSYSSQYLSLTAKEIFSNQALGNSYAPLDSLTSSDQSLFESVGKGSFPFIDIGGRYLISGASYDPGMLQGMTQAQIAAALSNTSSPIAKSIDGTANLITAAVCKVATNTPETVCSSPGVSAAAAALP